MHLLINDIFRLFYLFNKLIKLDLYNSFYKIISNVLIICNIKELINIIEFYYKYNYIKYQFIYFLSKKISYKLIL